MYCARIRAEFSIMIPEIVNKKQEQIILICIVISLLLHIAVLLFYLNQKSDFSSFKKQLAIAPKKSTKPIYMTKTPPQPPAHRVHRAGTGTDAPKTEKALSMGTPQIQPPSMTPPVPHPPQQTPTPPTEPTPPKKIEKKAEQHLKQKKIITSPSGRIPMQQFFQDAIDEEQIQEQDTTSLKSALHFLAPQHIYAAMKQQAVDAPPTNGVAKQYGESKYLHYNQKIYQALQQSMNLLANRLSKNKYEEIMYNVQQPTRIRFALDQQGKLKGISILINSGNMLYDKLAYQIVTEGSYPPIPKSFNMHTTYHTYGIILMYDGARSYDNNIGVSPYLEGE